MSAGRYDLYIEKGATFEQLVTIVSCTGITIDLTDYTPRGQIRSDANSSTIIVALTVTILSATSLKISLTDTQTTALVTTGKTFDEVLKLVYDVELVKTSDSSVLRLLNGFAIISPEVTK